MQFNSIYQSENLYGDLFTKPLKAYSQFFATKVGESPSFIKKIVHVISGTIAYPIFGLLAGIGLAFKYPHAYSVLSHNNEALNTIIKKVRTFKQSPMGKLSMSCQAYSLLGKQPYTTPFLYHPNNAENGKSEMRASFNLLNEAFVPCYYSMETGGTIKERHLLVKLDTYNYVKLK